MKPLLKVGDPVNEALVAIVNLLKRADEIPQLPDLTKMSVPRVKNKTLETTPTNAMPQKKHQTPSTTTINPPVNVIPCEDSECDV